MEKLTTARGRLVLGHPFFGSLALRLKFVEAKWLPTAGTDGKCMYYNPDFFNSLNEREIIGVIAHEVMHNAMGHSWRQGTRNHTKWNIAGDYAINGILIESGFELPKGRLVDAYYTGKSSEEIYNLLPDNQQQQQQSQSGNDGQNGQNQSGQNKGQSQDDNQNGQNQSGQRNQTNPNSEQSQNNQTSGSSQDSQENKYQDIGNCGISIPAKNDDENAELEAEWKVAVIQAAQIAKGSLSGKLKRLVDNITEPEIPWNILLRDFVELSARNDYNFSRTNNRHLVMNTILPALISEELPEVVIAIDTSGSIDDKTLLKFCAEASEVLSTYDTTIHVVYCDSKVKGTEDFTRADLPMEIHPKGGGGTDFIPVFDFVSEQNYTPSCVIYFTDLEGHFPEYEPDYPVLWVTTSKTKTAPFGKTVKFN